MAALEMLNIMETKPASPFGAFSPMEMHKRIEAMKLAYSDVHRYNCRPARYDVPRRAAALERVRQKARRAHRSRRRPIAPSKTAIPTAATRPT
jgi:gamma-glutamyltranspeptidase